MFVLHESNPKLSVVAKVKPHDLSLESKIQDLPLYDFQAESCELGKKVAYQFQVNQLLPGVILMKQGQLAGMISRRRFLEQMSSPYGLELFLKRPLASLYRFAGTEVLKLEGNMLIEEAARHALQRPAQVLYEPIVVEIETGVYRLLDVHELLIAQSHVHQLTTQLLKEQTEAQMIQTEKMASLGKMVASVAHEIKNPATCISCNFEFIESYYQNLLNILAVYEAEMPQVSDKVQEIKEKEEFDFILEDFPNIIKSISTALDRLTETLGSLHNFSHLGESKPQPADINECLESTLIILNNRLKSGIEVIKAYGDLPLVNCYSGQLSQVFMNIISNAIEALGDKLAEQKQRDASIAWQPQIKIVTEILEKRETEFVSIRIADNGPGIPPEIQERIFEMFFTTKPVGKGTGLGLAISNQIITKKHHGQLFLCSHPDTGTEFQIIFPLIGSMENVGYQN
ncbi:MAG: ATP-binding protein [Symploca sp. SIO2E6]|nr:ATP-binding protein [Symploca sp. SIO2E6]